MVVGGGGGKPVAYWTTFTTEVIENVCECIPLSSVNLIALNGSQPIQHGLNHLKNIIYTNILNIAWLGRSVMILTAAQFL